MRETAFRESVQRFPARNAVSVYELAHFRAQNRPCTFVENAQTAFRENVQRFPARNAVQVLKQPHSGKVCSGFPPGMRSRSTICAFSGQNRVCTFVENARRRRQPRNRACQTPGAGLGSAHSSRENARSRAFGAWWAVRSPSGVFSRGGQTGSSGTNTHGSARFLHAPTA